MGLSVEPLRSCVIGGGHSFHSLYLATHLQPSGTREEQVTGNSEQDTASHGRPHCPLSLFYETLLCSVATQKPITLSFLYLATLPTILGPFLHPLLPSPGSPHSLRTQTTHDTAWPLSFLSPHHCRKEGGCDRAASLWPESWTAPLIGFGTI